MDTPTPAPAFTGASGAREGLRLLECLRQSAHPVPLMFPKLALAVIGAETDLTRPTEAEHDLPVRILDHLEAPLGLMPRWGEPAREH